MRHLSFDLAQEDFTATDLPLRNLDDERGRFAPTIVMMTFHATRPRPPKSDCFGRRTAPVPATLH